METRISLVQGMATRSFRALMVITVLLLGTSDVARAAAHDWQDHVQSMQLTAWNFFGQDNEEVIASSHREAAMALSCLPEVNISLGQGGFAILTSLTLVNAPAYPPHQYEVDIMGPLTNTVYCEQIGQTLMVMVTELPTGNACMSSIYVEDKLKPTFSCAPDTVPCTVDIFSLDFEEYLEGAFDNCDDDLSLWSSFTIQNLPCNPHHLTQLVTVTWTATDNSGNSATCQDFLYLKKPAPGQIVFPPNISISCVDANTDPSVTGVPTFNGEPLDHTCQYIVFKNDQVVPMCNGAQKIIRVWTAKDWCTSAQISMPQEILIVDDTPPSITCPANVTINTSANACTTKYTLPQPIVSDLCADPAQIDVDITIAGIPGIFSPGQMINLSIGTTLITMKATDPCGNSRMCQYSVTVRDNTPPIPACHPLVVTLGADGMAFIYANELDFDVIEACGILSRQVWRTTNLCGVPSDLVPGPEVKFCCADVGTTVMVGFKVTDLSGNMGTCMFQVTVMDKTPPLVECQDITVSVTGQGDIVITPDQVEESSSDNCQIITHEVTPNTFDCSDIGEHIVTLTVTDQSGNTATCTAIVTIIDEVPPVAECQDLTVTVDENGEVTITTGQIDNGSFDNCAIDTMFLNQYDFDCDDEGENIITLTVVDFSGNEDQCTATVTVLTSPPVAECQNITVSLDANGQVTITADQVDDGSTDDCGIDTITVNPSTFDCDDIGVVVVTLTVTDISGNTSTCTASVTIQDNMPPTALCQDITVMLDENGNATITAAEIDDNSFDNCEIISITVTPTNFTCEDVGNNIVTLTVTDQSGNTSTCTATVMVEMPDPPMAQCQDITVTLNQDGVVEIDPLDINDGSTTQCGDLTFTVTPDTMTCEDVGEINIVVLTVTDETGSTATCTAQVTVNENPPVAICQNITVSLDENGDATITALQVNNNSTDDCGIISYVVTPDDFDCTDLGPNIVTLTVTDGSGFTSTCTATVTVEDNTPPTAVCQDITIELDGNGMATIIASDIDNGSSDNCDDFTLSADPTSFTCEDIGPNIVTLTVTDASGNTSTCTATVTVDADPPVAQCQDITVTLNQDGIVEIDPLDINDGSSSQCGDLTFMVTPDTMTCEDVGEINIVVLTVTDETGSTATCTAQVTVNENPPVAICQNITVSLDENGEATITALQVNNNSSDDCGIISYVVTPDDFDCTDLGPNIVTLTVTDGSGLTSTCTATVTVEDNIPPTAVCQDITIELDGNGMATIIASDIDNGSSDNCDGFTLSADPTSFTCEDIGPNIVTLTVTDASGNTSTCTATVTVDAEPPAAQCQDITVSLDANGIVVITPDQVDAGSGSNCGNLDLDLDEDTFDCTELGLNIVTLTVTDMNGNSSTCTATVTVVDDDAPLCSAQDLTVFVNADGQASIDASQINDGSDDNCFIDTITVTPTDFDCSDLGPNVVTLTVTDQSGNSSTCTATVTVVDTISPLCETMDITVSINGNGMVSITASQVDGGSSDNCGPPSLSVTPNTFDCEDLGPNIVVLTVTDASGNSSTCTATVTVNDNGMLDANCQNVTIFLDANGNASVDPEQVNNGSGGGCDPGILEFDLSQTDFTCTNLGPNIVVLTVTDENGNTATCTAVITVVDLIPPQITCPPNVTVDCHTVTNPDNTSQFGNATATDNCPGTVVTETHVINLNDCHVGTIVRTFTATDASGNTATCVQTVTIANPDPLDEDDITWPPSPVSVNICNSTDPEDIPNGEPVIDPTALLCADVEITFSDVMQMFVDNNPNTPCKVITRTWTIEDACQPNGTFTFVQIINVQDMVGPVFTNINDMTKVATANCTAFFTLIASATDCAGVSITNNSPFGANTGANASGNYPIGVTTVIFTATDGCGNTTTMDVVITVTDPDPTEFLCEKVIFILPEELEVAINAHDFITFFEGNCTNEDDFIISYSSTNPFDTLRIFDCGDVGVQTFPLWFWNATGTMKVDSCDNADLDLRDPLDHCGDGLVLGGEVENEDGLAIEGVEVAIMNAPMTPDTTNATGEFALQGLSEATGYEVAPHQDRNHREGVSTLDLVLIQKHLLGISKLSSPYKIIAADANRSGHITAIDLIEIRKVILGINMRFPHTTSWRFIDKAYQFPNPYNPFAPGFPETVWVDSVAPGLDRVDFIGVKTGDVNGSFFNAKSPDEPIEIRGSVSAFKIQAQPDISADGQVKAWDLVASPGQGQLHGLQFGIEVGSLTPDQVLGIASEVLSPDQWYYNPANGQILISWAVGLGEDIAGRRLLTIPAVPGQTISWEITKDLLEAEAYQEEDNIFSIRPVRLDVQEAPALVVSEYHLYQNIPNPFNESTVIRFSLPAEEMVRLIIHDVTGRQVYIREMRGQAGNNELQINQQDLGSSGIFYYSLYTLNASFSRKMSVTKE